MTRIPKKILQHLFSLLLVGVVLISTALSLAPQPRQITTPPLYYELDFVDFQDPFQHALLGDILNLYQPGQTVKNDSLV